MEPQDHAESDPSCSSTSSSNISSAEEEIYADDYGITPYQFEPAASENDSSGSSENDDSLHVNRLLSTDWCLCGNCNLMAAMKECRCCAEIPEMVKLNSDKHVQCITQHPAFQSLCLDVYVLQTCYSWFHQQYNRSIEDENNRLRYTAYRMLTRFAWGWLGKDIRVSLPACAVLRIRREFPSVDGQYTGYLEPEHK